jgi:hypothetical protein
VLYVRARGLGDAAASYAALSPPLDPYVASQLDQAHTAAYDGNQPAAQQALAGATYSRNNLTDPAALALADAAIAQETAYVQSTAGLAPLATVTTPSPGAPAPAPSSSWPDPVGWLKSTVQGYVVGTTVQAVANGAVVSSDPAMQKALQALAQNPVTSGVVGATTGSPTAFSAGQTGADVSKTVIDTGKSASDLFAGLPWTKIAIGAAAIGVGLVALNAFFSGLGRRK